MKEKVLILIPVKENSKRLPNKNFLMLDGLELWRHAHKAAVLFWLRTLGTRLKVCSEGEKVKKYIIVESYLQKPPYLSEDPYELVDTCLYACDSTDFTTLIMIQPSNPFVTDRDIQRCYDLFLESGRITVRSVTKVGKTTWRPADYIYIGGDEDCHNGEDSDNVARIPIITPYSVNAYVGNGSIVVIDVEQLKKEKTLASIKTIPYEMGGVDIDTEQDFILAEILIGRRN